MKNRLLIYLSKRVIACEEAGYLVSYRYDHRLGLKQWWHLKLHLYVCHLCSKYASQIEQLNRAVVMYRKATSNGVYLHHLPEEKSLRILRVLNEQMNAN